MPTSTRPGRRTAGCRSPRAAAGLGLGLCLALGLVAVPASAQPREIDDHSSCSPLRTPPPPTPGDAQLAQEWVLSADRFSSQYFDVVTDLPRDEATRLATHMDVMHETYRSTLGRLRESGGGTRELWLIAGVDDYVRVVAREFDADVRGVPGASVADGSTDALVACIEMTRPVGATPPPGAGTGVARTTASASPSLLHVLRHEGFHQAQASLLPDLPAWAAEGLAEVFAHAVIVGDSAIVGEVPADRLARLKQASRARRLEPLETFMASGSGGGDRGLQGRGLEKREHWNASPERGYVEPRFDQAWATVHLLLFGDGGSYRPAFTAYLSALSRGTSPRSAWTTAFKGVSPRDIEPALITSIDEGSATDIAQSLQRLAFLAEGMLHLAAGERADAPDSFESLREQLAVSDFTGSVDAAGGLTAADPAFQGDGFRLVPCGRGVPPCIAATATGPVQLGVKWTRDRRSGLRWTYVWE